MSNCEIRILGGLPVEVDFEVDDMGVHINDFYKVQKRRMVRMGDWVWKRIEATQGEMERIEKAVFDAFIDACEDAKADAAYDRMLDRQMGY